MKLYEYDYDMLRGLGDPKLLNEEDLGRLFVSSSNIQSFWFDEYKKGDTKPRLSSAVKDRDKKTARFRRSHAEGTLTVEFLSGAGYEYYYVPSFVVDAFTRAPSYGRFLWKNIRGYYPYRRIY